MQTIEKPPLRKVTLTKRSPASLSSETYPPRTLPAVLGAGDLTALFLLNVFWVTNVTPLAAGGNASFTYWLIGGLLFFVPCRFHDLRHSLATALLDLGTNPKIVQEVLGHSAISMTMDIYSHVLPTMQQEAMSRLNEALQR